MFRKPMRIEKWIAFDGVGIADLADTAEVDPDADDTGSAWQDEDHSASSDEAPAGVHAAASDPDPALPAFFLMQSVEQTSNTLYLNFADYPEYDGMVSLTFPIGVERPDHVDPAQTMYLPFLDDSRIALNIDPSAGIELTHLFIGVSFPENGSFTIYSPSLGISFSEFVLRNNIPVGTVIAYSPEGIPTSGDSTGTIRIGTVVAYGASGTSFGLDDTMHVARGSSPA